MTQKLRIGEAWLANLKPAKVTAAGKRQPVLESQNQTFRYQKQTAEPLSLKKLLSKPKGNWDNVDGLEYQRKLQSEWDDK